MKDGPHLMENFSDVKEQVLRSTLEQIKSSNPDALSSSGDGPTQDPCVICLEQVSEKAEALPCHHSSFDFLCLLSWFEESTKCPLCKTEVKEVSYGRAGKDGVQKYSVNGPTKETEAGVVVTSSSLNRRSRPRPQLRQRRARTIQAPLSPDAALQRRQDVYKYQLFSLHIGSNRLSRFQDLTPAKFVHDEELISRARKWIRRELQVFEFLRADDPSSTAGRRRVNNAEYLLEYIIAILKSVDIKGSGGQAEDMLQEFLGREKTILFLHELRSWLRSPYSDLDVWDRHVQYGEANTAPAEPRKVEGEREWGGGWRGRGDGGDGEHGNVEGGESRKRKGDYYRPGVTAHKRCRRGGLDRYARD